MRAILIATALAFIALSARARTMDESWTRCSGNDPDASIVACTALNQSGPKTNADLATALYDRGTSYDIKRLYDQAIADYTEAIVLDPNSVAPYNNRGVAYNAKGLYDLAIADETKAIALKPDAAECYWNRGVAYQAKGRRDQAIADFRVALNLIPDKTNGMYQDSMDRLKRLVATPFQVVAIFSLTVPSHELGGADLNAGLRAQEMTLVAPLDQPVVLIDEKDVSDGEAVIATQGRNVLMQNGGHSCQYTLSFVERPHQAISFNRSHLVAGPSGITHPVWTATAFDANGRILSSVSEPEIRRFTDVPAKRFTLNGPGINRITFWATTRRSTVSAMSSSTQWRSSADASGRQIDLTREF